MANIDDIKIKELYLRHLSNPLLAKQITESNNLETLLVTRPYAFETTDPKLIHVVQEEAGGGEDPEEVTNLTVAATPDNVIFNWDTPTSEPSYYILALTLYKDKEGHIQPEEWMESPEVTGNQWETPVDSDDARGCEYKIKIKAVYEDHDGPWSSMVEFDIPIKPVTHLDTPDILVETVGTTNMRLVWNHVENANYYEYEWGMDYGGAETHTGTVQEPVLDLENLEPATSYKIKVRAYNTAYNIYSDWGEKTESTAIVVPSDPENLNIVDTSVNHITISWDASENTDEYDVTIEQDGAVIAQERTSNTEHTFTDLAPNTSYNVLIYALNWSYGTESNTVSILANTSQLPAPQFSEIILGKDEDPHWEALVLWYSKVEAIGFDQTVIPLETEIEYKEWNNGWHTQYPVEDGQFYSIKVGEISQQYGMQDEVRVRSKMESPTGDFYYSDWNTKTMPQLIEAVNARMIVAGFGELEDHFRLPERMDSIWNQTSGGNIIAGIRAGAAKKNGIPEKQNSRMFMRWNQRPWMDTLDYRLSTPYQPASSKFSYLPELIEWQRNGVDWVPKNVEYSAASGNVKYFECPSEDRGGTEYNVRLRCVFTYTAGSVYSEPFNTSCATNPPLVSGLQVSINGGDAVASWDTYPTAQFEATSWRNIVVLCKEEGGQWVTVDEDRTNNSETSYTFHGLNPEYHYAVKTMFEYIKFNCGVWLEGEWSDLVEFDMQDEGISTEP